jgi:hypothetical protein
MNVLQILGKIEVLFLSVWTLSFDFSLGGGTCYDLINAFACFCPDRVFRPQCNVTNGSPAVRSTSVLMSSSNNNNNNNNINDNRK